VVCNSFSCSFNLAESFFRWAISVSNLSGLVIERLYQKNVLRHQKKRPIATSLVRYGSMGAGQPNPARANSTSASTTKISSSGAACLLVILFPRF